MIRLEKNRKRSNVFIYGAIVLMLLLSSTIASLAYFSSELSGNETSQTIVVTGGTLNIHYESGRTIIAENIIPDNNAFGSKEFTVTGNNTTDITMPYYININVI